MPQPVLEILAPAGDEEMMRAAVFSGADCVYLGFAGFNARRGAGNFTAETLPGAVAFCHARGCRVYAALNTLVFPGREAAFAEALRCAYEAGCDAAIVQDPAAATLAKEVAPGLPLHASTQMSVHSLAGVKQLAAWGFTRAILARELREAEIAEIAAASPIELEVFVHGALCLSVSGQCYFSAFLGGRSGNRGGCAGPCRLPFRCGEGPAAGEGDAALSLKDLSLLQELPRLAALGVASAKIEGRLRGAEYCAAVVDAAVKAREGRPYDEAFLQDVFSRGAFTGGWYAGGTGREMFGRRSEADAGKTKKAQPAARELYRRERPRVPVEMGLHLAPTGGRLWAADGVCRVEALLPGPLAPAESPQTQALRRALGKTGGTPFYLAEEPYIEDAGLYAPGPVVAAARRQVLEELLALRGQRPQRRGQALPPAAGPRSGPPRRVAGLRARFAHLGGMPAEAAALCTELLLPLEEAPHIPPALRGKTRLVLPRFLAGEAEREAAAKVAEAATRGFLGFEAGNLAHLELCRGLPLAGGFGLNLTNGWAAARLAGAGCTALTASVELSAAQLRHLAADCPPETRLDVLAYGHLPLMLTRACPLQTGGDCRSCGGEYVLTDRKGRQFPMDCQSGMRSLYNPVPLWLGDRLDELAADTATLYFTRETPEEAGEILRAFAAGKAAPGDFTRGLLDKGTES